MSDAIHQLEADMPYLSQVLPVFTSLKRHAEAWVNKVEVPAALASGVQRCVQQRYERHLHPAWFAANALDPIYAEKRLNDTWELPFRRLTEEERGAAKQLIARLSGCSTDDELERLQAELATLRLEALPAGLCDVLPVLTARKDLGDGRVGLASVGLRQGWWEREASEHFPLTARAAVKLLAAHVTTGAAERNWSLWGRIFQAARSKLAIKTAEKLAFLAGASQQGGERSSTEVAVCSWGKCCSVTRQVDSMGMSMNQVIFDTMTIAV